MPKRVLSLFLALLCLSLCPLCAAAAEGGGADCLSASPGGAEHVSLPAEEPSPAPEDLAGAWLEKQLLSRLPDAGVENIKRAGNELSGATGISYRVLRGEIAEIAAGRRASTVIPVPIETLVGENAFTAERLGVEAIVADGRITDEAVRALSKLIYPDMNALHTALLADCPFDLYWYDKTVGFSRSAPDFSARKCGGEWVLRVNADAVEYSFAVSAAFAGDGDYTVGDGVARLLERVNSSIDDILWRSAGLSDLEKLRAYRDAIVALVDYDYDSWGPDGAARPYGNPWQLLYVFDGDESTKVVCEGYAKAFAYLCDLSLFDGNVTAWCVSGTMDHGTGAGAHMWNLVTLPDGRNYLVDLTNSDLGDHAEAVESLFLAPRSSGNLYTSYRFKTELVAQGVISYSYSEDMYELYTAQELTVSSARFSPDGAPAGIALNEYHFPDPVFRALLAGEADADGDGALNEAERNAVRSLDCAGRGIADLTGLALFPALEELDCGDNQLVSLDLGGNPRLRRLDCAHNAIVSLDLSPCPALLEAAAGEAEVSEDGLVLRYAPLPAEEGAGHRLVVDAATRLLSAPARLAGDCNGDGLLDGRDAIRLLKHLAGISVELVPDNAEVTGDGVLDGRDAIRLLKRLAGQAVPLG